MKTIFAIIIDPATRTVTREQLVADPDGSFYRALKTAVFGANDDGRLIEHVAVGASHGIYIDEEGLLVDWDKQSFFRMGLTLTVAGRAVLVRDTEDGDSDTCQLPLELVASKIEWIEAKDVRVPAPTMTTTDDDGNDEVTLLAGREYWDYQNQPH